MYYVESYGICIILFSFKRHWGLLQQLVEVFHHYAWFYTLCGECFVSFLSSSVWPFLRMWWVLLCPLVVPTAWRFLKEGSWLYPTPNLRLWGLQDPLCLLSLFNVLAELDSESLLWPNTQPVSTDRTIRTFCFSLCHFLCYLHHKF